MLILDANKLSVLPTSLGQLTSLHTLSLSDNQVTELPEWLGQLASLQALFLDGNQLSALPEAIGRLDKLQRLYLHNNPALNLPPEVLGPDWGDVEQVGKTPANVRAILAYYWRSRSQQSRTLSEAKLLLVGQGGVGKTSLVRYLVENEPCEKGFVAPIGFVRSSHQGNAMPRP
jgi:internalin A